QRDGEVRFPRLTRPTYSCANLVMFPTLAIGVGEAINLGIAVPFCNIWLIRLAPLRTLATATVPLVKVALIWKETPSAIEDCAGMRHTPVTPAFTPDGKGPENQVSCRQTTRSERAALLDHLLRRTHR